MSKQILSWKTLDGIDIHGVHWSIPSGVDLKGVICLVHGFGEHCERYGHVAEVFNNNGYALVAYDQRGHGKSKGQRGHTPSYNHLLDDVDLLFKKVDELYPGAEKIIYGHSMGGGVVANYLIRRKSDVVAGILSAPLFITGTPPPPFLLALGKFMNNIWGAFPNKAPLDANDISRDKAEVKKYMQDPLNHKNMSARLGMSILDNGQYAIDHASEIHIPVLVLHGTADKLTSCEGSRQFKFNAGNRAKMIEYNGFYHELHNEPEKEQVFSDILEWCNDLV